MTEHLDIGGDWKEAWDDYTRGLEQGRIHLNSVANSLLWAHNKQDGNVTAAFVYDLIVKSLSLPTSDKVYASIWCFRFPLKI